MRVSFFIFTIFLAMGTAFYGGFLWGTKTKKVESEPLNLAEKKTEIVIANAKISDIRVDAETKFAIRAAKKTEQKKQILESIKTTPGVEEKEAQPSERDAMCDLIQAQDEELTAVRALNVELLISRDSWRNACAAARNETAVARINHEAALATHRGSKLRVGLVSFSVGLVGGMLAK